MVQTERRTTSVVSDLRSWSSCAVRRSSLIEPSRHYARLVEYLSSWAWNMSVLSLL